MNLASVRKSEDPIRDTQTNPILYEQKKEEEKDGKKGPLMYHVKNDPHETFFIDPPIQAEPKTPEKVATETVLPTSTDTAGWWEEQSTGSAEAVAPAKEVVPTSLSEPIPGEEQVQEVKGTEKDSEPPVAEADAVKASGAKGEDYWW